MHYLLSFLLGFAASGIGIIPPGLLNMTALRISVSEGRGAAKIFVAGATLIIAIECYLAILFARYLGKHTEVVLALREVAFFIFLMLSLYFFFGTKKGNSKTHYRKIHSKSSRFFLGMLFSALNFLTVPFYVVTSLTLKLYEVFSFNQLYILIFVSGVVIGTGFGFYCFVTFFQGMEKYTVKIVRNMNYIIATILLLISLITGVSILEHYYG